MAAPYDHAVRAPPSNRGCLTRVMRGERRRFLCNVCGCANDTPMEFQCALGPDGQRLDVQEHPEMACGSVEYIAPQEYMVRQSHHSSSLSCCDRAEASCGSEVTSLSALSLTFALPSFKTVA